jgi:hypothetical protein
MYFLTQLDPNYSIKGSRDPLGFQKVWQDAGRKLIPHLSTVSNSVKDFQILCMAYSIKNEREMSDEDFELFFIRFEQLMGYIRFRQNENLGFNGIDKVRKLLSAGPSRVRISNAGADQLLSNQRNYGIWAKYNRVFRDLNMNEAPELATIYAPRLNSHEGFYKQVGVIAKKKKNEAAEVITANLDDYALMLTQPVKDEKRFFTELLLQDTCDNELRHLLNKQDDLRENVKLYQLLYLLGKYSANDAFKWLLQMIENTEKVICPLNRIFRHLQTRSFWSWEEIEEDEFIRSWRTKPATEYLTDETRTLANLLRASNSDLVRGLVARNEEVMKYRGFVSWLNIIEDGVEVNHFQGAGTWADFNPEEDADNAYFLNTFLSIYNQLN